MCWVVTAECISRNVSLFSSVFRVLQDQRENKAQLEAQDWQASQVFVDNPDQVELVDHQYVFAGNF